MAALAITSVAVPQLQPVHSFGLTDFSSIGLTAPLIQASDGYLYGTTETGQDTGYGAVTTVNEPGASGKVAPATFYGDWAGGKSFGIAAWDAQEQGNGEVGLYFQAVGDPFVKR